MAVIALAGGFPCQNRPASQPGLDDGKVPQAA